MIFIVRMIVNVRTLLIVVNSIYGYYEYFVATFGAVYKSADLKISTIHRVQQRGTFLAVRFVFVSIHTRKKRWGYI